MSEQASEQVSEEEERSAGEREGEEGFLREAVVVRGTWGSKEKRKKEGRQGSRVPSPVVQVGNGRVQRSPPGQRGGPEGQCGWAKVGEPEWTAQGCFEVTVLALAVVLGAGCPDRRWTGRPRNHVPSAL